MPFHVGAGVTHYYGVGAYKRPIAEVRRANVRFAAECLGFANVPEQSIVDLLIEGDRSATDDSRWKRRSPRDSGAGWDFEDVRDHYLRELFALDPGRLRALDTARYLELGRVTSGEVMSRVFSEWRSAYSHCHGGLVWFLKDLWPGAGWGILDSFGMPKAVFYYLRRAWQPQAIVLTDEGLDGIHVHVINETDRPLVATVELTLLRDGQFIAAQASTECRLAPRARATYGSDELLPAFHDVSYAYRFGPPAHDVVAAALHGPSGDLIGEAFWFPHPVEPARHAARAIKAEGRRVGDDSYEVALSSPQFVHAVHFWANGFLPEDNYFHLMPGRTKRVRFQPCADAPPAFNATVASLSWDDAVSVDIRA
jgi:beta-mannosidase